MTDRNDNAISTPRSTVRRLSTETKAAFKTTEFFAYVAVLVGIVIAGAIGDSSESHRAGPFIALLSGSRPIRARHTNQVRRGSRAVGPVA
jgi:hypothetical protein